MFADEIDVYGSETSVERNPWGSARDTWGADVYEADVFGQDFIDVPQDQLGEAIMLLEGGPTGLEGMMFGESIDFGALGKSISRSHRGQKSRPAVKLPKSLSPSMQKFAQKAVQKAVQRASVVQYKVGQTSVRDHRGQAVTQATIGATQQKLQNLIKTRTQAVTAASLKRKRLEGQVRTIGNQILRSSVQAANAIRTGQSSVVRQIQGQVQKLYQKQKMVASTAVRFGKAQALASVLVKNARAQSDLVSAAGALVNQGKPQQAVVLVTAAQNIEDQNKELKDLRERQVRVWESSVADRPEGREDSYDAAPDLPPEMPADLPSDEPPEAPSDVPADMMSESYSDSERGYPQEEPVMDDGTSPYGEDSVDEEDMSFEGLESLDFSWSSLNPVKLVKKAASAVKSVSKTVYNQVRNAGSAAVSLVKKGACLAVNNPNVTTALTAAVTGGVGAGAAQAAARVGQYTGFCNKKPAPKPAAKPRATNHRAPASAAAVQSDYAPPVAPTKSSAGLIVVPAAVAAALLLLA